MVGYGLVTLLLLPIKAIIGNEVAGGGTSHLEFAIDPFHRQRRRAIKLEILALGGIEEKPEIWLVPNFKSPTANLIASIALDEVPNRTLHQLAPLAQVVRRRHVRLPPKAANVRRRRQVLREKTKFHERANVRGQQSIEEVIDILKIEDQLAISITPARKHVVVEKPVKPQPASSAVLYSQAQMLTPTFPQPLVGPSRRRTEAPVEL